MLFQILSMQKATILTIKEFLNSYNLDKDDIILLSLSRLVRRKGHYMVIDIMKDLIKKYSKIKYLIAGTGDTNYELELKKYVKKLNLTKNILFLGHVNEEEKIVIYNLCNIFLMTSNGQRGK